MTSLATGGWGTFVVAYAAFLISHMVPARPAVRARLVATLGERGYLAGYGIVAVLILAWLIVAAGQAPYVALWPYAAWHVWLADVAMLAACVLAAFAIGASNPLSVGGRAGRFDPMRPGVAGAVRHPLLAALAIWAFVHALANGDLAHLLLFGGFLLFAVLGMRIVDWRRRRTMGEAAWRRMAAHTSNVPLAALIAGRWRPRPGPRDGIRLALGVGLWLLLVAIHPLVIGVSPLPLG